MQKKHIILLSAFLLCGMQGVFAQDTSEKTEEVPKFQRGLWEIGVGGAIINLNRVYHTNFRQEADKSYIYDTSIKDNYGGVGIYAAYGLTPAFYLDYQGTVGFATENLGGTKRNVNSYMGGLGLQWRLSPLFKSEWIEPYLRVGINYMYKNFDLTYSGGFNGVDIDKAYWNRIDPYKNDGKTIDKSNLFPASFGAGVNVWLNRNIGLGYQWEYLYPLGKDRPKFSQSSIRVIFRIGKKAAPAPKPIVQYVERVVEKPVEVEKIIEVVVEKPMDMDKQICELFDDITFEFDKDILTTEAKVTIEKIMDILKDYTQNRYLVTGFTDSRGKEDYNLDLSRRRAEAVVDALVSQGLPSTMFKSRGVGKRIAAVAASGTDREREGDRRVTVQRIRIPEYWDKLP